MLFVALLLLLATPPDDFDHDTLPDALEQELIERFAPRLFISATDCDLRPAEFQPGSATPKVLERNGTLYARVFPTATPGQVEIHYYHLWSRDCGRLAHPLDAERVSALLHAPAGEWRALYWYAAAHEDTVCDAGHGARAADLGAVERGPTVWVSHGKHASFLDQDRCRKGCGGDRCLAMAPLVPPRIINIGEPGAPLNGATWFYSPAWPYTNRLKSDFPPSVLTQYEAAPPGIIPINTAPAPVTAVVSAGGTTINALGTGRNHTGSALSTANNKTGNALRRANRAVRRFLGLTPKEK